MTQSIHSSNFIHSVNTGSSSSPACSDSPTNMIQADSSTTAEKTLRQRRPLKDLNIIDNFLFNELTSQQNDEDSKRFCTILIETLLGWKIGDVHITPQKQYQGLDTNLHGICIDVQVEALTYKPGEEIPSVEVCPDIYDIEPNTYKGDEPKRARFYTALIDSRSLQSGVRYKEMKNIYLLMITPYDPFGADSMIYTVQSKCLEVPDISYEDGITCIFLYTRGKKNIPSQKVADMLHFIEKSTVDNASASGDCQMLYEMVENIKSQHDVGVRYMKACEYEYIYREEGKKLGRAEGEKLGRAQGMQQNLLENIRNLMDTMNWTAQQAMAALKVPENEQPKYEELLK